MEEDNKMVKVYQKVDEFCVCGHLRSKHGNVTYLGIHGRMDEVYLNEGSCSYDDCDCELYEFDDSVYHRVDKNKKEEEVKE